MDNKKQLDSTKFQSRIFENNKVLSNQKLISKIHRNTDYIDKEHNNQSPIYKTHENLEKKSDNLIRVISTGNLHKKKSDKTNDIKGNSYANSIPITNDSGQGRNANINRIVLKKDLRNRISGSSSPNKRKNINVNKKYDKCVMALPNENYKYIHILDQKETKNEFKTHEQKLDSRTKKKSQSFSNLNELMYLGNLYENSSKKTNTKSKVKTFNASTGFQSFITQTKDNNTSTNQAQFNNTSTNFSKNKLSQDMGKFNEKINKYQSNYNKDRAFQKKYLPKVNNNIANLQPKVANQSINNTYSNNFKMQNKEWKKKTIDLTIKHKNGSSIEKELNQLDYNNTTENFNSLFIDKNGSLSNSAGLVNQVSNNLRGASQIYSSQNFNKNEYVIDSSNRISRFRSNNGDSTKKVKSRDNSE